MPKNAAANLAALESLKRSFGSAEKNIQRLLTAIGASKLTDPDQLIRFHETLLFYRAYPPSARVLKQVEKILGSFAARVSELSAAEVDLSPLDDPEETPDPWGNSYLVKVSAGGAGLWLISAGPNGLIETPFDVPADGTRGDDITKAVTLRAIR